MARAAFSGVRSNVSFGGARGFEFSRGRKTGTDFRAEGLRPVPQGVSCWVSLVWGPGVGNARGGRRFAPSKEWTTLAEACCWERGLQLFQVQRGRLVTPHFKV